VKLEGGRKNNSLRSSWAAII